LRQFAVGADFCQLCHQAAKERGMVGNDRPFARCAHHIGVFVMRIRILPTAVAIIVACLQAGPLLAQSTPGSDTAPMPAPVASPVPAASPAPAPTPAAAATSPATAGDEAAKPKSPKRIRISAQTRLDIAHSLKTGTVPTRYRSQIPKQYQRYIPFQK
jgi:hypothetical protein